MITLQRKFIHQAKNAEDITELFSLLQHAIELEHSTIPPYLTAMFSFKPNKGKEIRAIIHSIVIEEMLHMSIVANILNALGGSPVMNSHTFTPEYPGPLPMGIGDDLQVGLEPYSISLVENVFMKIEEPENPLHLQFFALERAEPEFGTIGEFYLAIQAQIDLLAPHVLPGNPVFQVTSPFFSSDQLFPILTKEDAVRAINIIIQQGEGTMTAPVDREGEIAHYYQFEQLVRGQYLIKNPMEPHGYSFSGAKIQYDSEDIYPVFPNTKQSMFMPGSEEWRRLYEFNTSYSSLLNGLNSTFNGAPETLNATIGLMYDLKLYAEKLCAIPFPGKDGHTIGPSFELTPVVPR